MTALSDWLHALPASHVQALRDFRRLAKGAYPTDRNYLGTAFDLGSTKIAELMAPAARPAPALTPYEAGIVIAAMPRELVLLLRV